VLHIALTVMMRQQARTDSHLKAAESVSGITDGCPTIANPDPTHNMGK